MKGRKPTPARLKLLLNDPQRVIGGTNAPKKPDWLEGDAAEEWTRIIDELSKLYLITELDAVTLAAYCKVYAMWRQYDRIVTEDGPMTVDGTGCIKPNPAAKMCLSLFTELRRMAGEFGFSPAARSRLDTAPQENQEDAAFDAFEAGQEQVG